MQPISFGRKIPVATCNIQNKRTKELSKAIIYEHDARDSADVQYFKNLPKHWKFGREVSENISLKHAFQHVYVNDRYFSIENKEGMPIGLMQISDNCDFIDVEFLEAHDRKKYNFIGTNLLAYAGMTTLNEGQDRLIISEALKKARPFYIEHCGFRQNNKILEMKREEIPNFVQKSQAKTKIMDLWG